MLCSSIAKKGTFSKGLQHALAFLTSHGVEFSLSAYVSIVAKKLYLPQIGIYMHFFLQVGSKSISTQKMHYLDFLDYDKT